MTTQTMWIRGWSNSASLEHCCHGARVVKSSISAVVTSAGSGEIMKYYFFGPWCGNLGMLKQTLQEWKVKVSSGWKEHSFQETQLVSLLPHYCNSLDIALWSSGYLLIWLFTTFPCEFVFGVASLYSLSSALIAGWKRPHCQSYFPYGFMRTQCKWWPDHKLASVFTAFHACVLKLPQTTETTARSLNHKIWVIAWQLREYEREEFMGIDQDNHYTLTPTQTGKCWVNWGWTCGEEPNYSLWDSALLQHIYDVNNAIQINVTKLIIL